MRWISVGCVVLSTGCAIGVKGPANGAIATGQPVAVVDDVKTWTTQYQEKTGTTEVSDADGNLVATEDHYQERTAVHHKKIWYPVQGKQQISDEDFFRITGDTKSMERTRDMRAKGRLYEGVGIAGMLVGIAGMVAGKFVTNSTAQIGLITGGSIVGLAGAYGFYVGFEMQSPDTHAVDRSLAESAARDYNQKTGHNVGIGVNGRF